MQLAPDQPPPIPVQQQLDEQRVLREAISDEFDTGTLLDIDDALSFRRPGIGTDVTRKLRKGDWSIQGEIDLHGLRREDAREALAGFIREAHRRGWRCVRVVHGKGLGSPGKTPVLKGKVQGWLIQKNEVLAFVQARADEGGAGALVVLLKPSPGSASARLPAGAQGRTWATRSAMPRVPTLTVCAAEIRSPGLGLRHARLRNARFDLHLGGGGNGRLRIHRLRIVERELHRQLRRRAAAPLPAASGCRANGR